MDFHCHLDLYTDARKVYQETLRRNRFTLLVTTSPRAYLATRKVLPPTDSLVVTPGLHPEIAAQKAGERQLLLEQIDSCSAVGEVGLDGSPVYRSSFELQQAILADVLLKCAAAGGRVVSLHSRRAASGVLDLIERSVGCGTPVLHWFSGTPKELQRATELGCWFSVGPAMLRSESGRRLAMLMPRSRVVPESDGPFAKLGSEPVMPWDASSISKELATCWAEPEDAVAAQLITNGDALTARIRQTRARSPTG